MYQKRLSKVKKKVCLEAKKAKNNKKHSNNKNAGNHKDASPLAPTVVTSPDYPIPIATFFSLFAPVATSPDLSTLGSINASPTSTTSTSIIICFSPFSFSVWPSLLYFLTCYTTPISSSLIQVFRSILLIFKDDYAVQHSVSLLKRFKKQLQ